MCNVFQEIHSSNIWSLARFQICTCCCHSYNRKHAVKCHDRFFLFLQFFCKRSAKITKPCGYFATDMSFIMEFNIINKISSIWFKTSFEQHKGFIITKQQQLLTGRKRKWRKLVSSMVYTTYGPALLKYDGYYRFIKHCSAHDQLCPVNISEELQPPTSLGRAAGRRERSHVLN